MSTRPPVLRRLVAAVLAGAVALTATACTRRAPAASDDPMADMPGMAHVHAPSARATPAVVPADPAGTGLSASHDGYTFVPSTGTVAAGSATFTFHVSGPDGHAVTSYQPYESRLVQCYVIRSDLTGFRYLDAAMNQDGLWSAPLPELPAGSYRAFVTFAAPDAAHGTPLLYDLSRPLTVTGPAAPPTEAPSTVDSMVSTVDGYTVTLAVKPERGRRVPLTVTVVKDGHPVESFNRYLDGYAHLTAFHAGDLALARIESAGAIGQGGALTAAATFPQSGTWRVFAQFDQGGTVHTAGFTVAVP